MSNIDMFPKVKIIFPLIFLIFSSQTVLSQKRSIKTKKPTQTISMGVINARAIDLEIPVFPKTAWTLGLYGVVQIEVLVDETGSVTSAKTLSGNPIFYSSVTKAALQSRFEPIKIAGQPVRVKGIISYHFLPEQFNVFETGYILGNFNSGFYSIKNLADKVPNDLAEETRLLKQSNNELEKIRQTVTASIQNKLLGDKKSSWLFSVGLNLSKTKTQWKPNEYSLDNGSENFQILRSLVFDPPSEIKPSLILELKKFIIALEQNKTSEAFSVLQEMETKFPFLGG